MVAPVTEIRSLREEERGEGKIDAMRAQKMPHIFYLPPVSAMEELFSYFLKNDVNSQELFDESICRQLLWLDCHQWEPWLYSTRQIQSLWNSSLDMTTPINVHEMVSIAAPPVSTLVARLQKGILMVVIRLGLAIYVGTKLPM